MKKLLLTILIGALAGLANTAQAEDSIPSCSQNYGTLALREPDTNRYWWRQYNLESPEALIKVMVNESGCFTMVDRGEGMDMRRDERDLADSGELQVNSNMGKGQVLAADYFLIPDLLTKDKDSGGRGIGGLIGGRVGGEIGGLLGGMKTKNLEAETVLTLVDARTSAHKYAVKGYAKKTDLKFGGGGLLGSVAAAGGGYDDTEIGKVIATSYSRAYNELVGKMQQGGGSAASNAAPTQAYTMAVDGEMYTGPSRGQSVRKMRAGMNVYPTGNRNGAFLEVKDKFGTTGWVSVEDLQ